MKRSKAILATVALGALLAVGSATTSMAAHGHGGGGFGGAHIGGGFGGHGFGRGFGGHGFGDHGFGRFRGGLPFVMHGGRYRGLHGQFFRHDYGRYGPRLGSLFGPYFYGDDDYGYNYGAGYCVRVHPSYNPHTGTYVGRNGVLHYCP